MREQQLEAMDALRHDFVQGMRNGDYEPLNLRSRFKEIETLTDELKGMVNDMNEGNNKFIEHPEKLIYPDAFLSEDEEDITNPDLN